MSSESNLSPAKTSKPPWLKVKAAQSGGFKETTALLRLYGLPTVCEEAACPNIGECWTKKHATFMILGSICTRACAFCNVQTGLPGAVDPNEPKKLAKVISELKLNHVVITSVDRDDLEDGGASHFIDCIKEIRKSCNSVTIEILTPDFRAKGDAALAVAEAKPDVYNHNIETVPRLYRSIRPGSRYFNSLNLLSLVKREHPDLFTKSGMMVGLGETKDEIIQVMEDLRSADVDFLTIGQYLRPTSKHAPVDRYVTPEEFKEYEIIARSRGFLMVSSSPLTRSSYHAGDDFMKLRKARDEYLRKEKEKEVSVL